MLQSTKEETIRNTNNLPLLNFPSNSEENNNSKIKQEQDDISPIKKNFEEIEKLKDDYQCLMEENFHIHDKLREFDKIKHENEIKLFENTKMKEEIEHLSRTISEQENQISLLLNNLSKIKNKNITLTEQNNTNEEEIKNLNLQYKNLEKEKQIYDKKLFKYISLNKKSEKDNVILKKKNENLMNYSRTLINKISTLEEKESFMNKKFIDLLQQKENLQFAYNSNFKKLTCETVKILESIKKNEFSSGQKVNAAESILRKMKENWNEKNNNSPCPDIDIQNSGWSVENNETNYDKKINDSSPLNLNKIFSPDVKDSLNKIFSPDLKDELINRNGKASELFKITCLEFKEDSKCVVPKNILKSKVEVENDKENMMNLTNMNNQECFKTFLTRQNSQNSHNKLKAIINEINSDFDIHEKSKEKIISQDSVLNQNGGN